MPMYEIYSWARGGGYFLGEVEVGGGGRRGLFYTYGKIMTVGQAEAHEVKLQTSPSLILLCCKQLSESEATN